VRAQIAIPCLLILVGLRTVTFAQALVEHAAIAAPAAAGSSTGAMIGSKLSATLDTAAELSKSAVGPAAKHPATEVVRPELKPGAAVTGGTAPVARGPQVVWTRGMERRAPLVHSGPAGRQSMNESPAAPRPVSAARVSGEDVATRLATVTPGMTRQDLVSRLGAPSYTIAMTGDDGRQVERMRFRAMGEDLATVEVRDGVVASVTKRAP
jgi:hypothetical protein